MFSVTPLQPLHNAILELVAHSPGMTMREIHEGLVRRYKMKTSLQHVYRVVTHMIGQQILVKAQGTVTLNIMWVSYLSFFAQRAARAASESQVAQSDFPLKEGGRRVYKAGSAMEVETIWNHVLVQIHRKGGGSGTLHKYYSHAWWLLGKHARDISFYKQLSDRGIRCLWLFGNDTPLDRLGTGLLKSVFTTVLADKSPFPKEGYNLNVYGDHIVECIFPEKISKHLAAFFAGAKSQEEFDQEMFLDLLHMRSPCKVTVWRNAAQAETLRRKIGALVE